MIYPPKSMAIEHLARKESIQIFLKTNKECGRHSFYCDWPIRLSETFDPRSIIGQLED